MVSPAPSASSKPPMLSYAERAKKARNINPQTPLATRNPPHATSSPTSAPTASTAPSAPLTSSNPVPEPEISIAPTAPTTNHQPPQQAPTVTSSADNQSSSARDTSGDNSSPATSSSELPQKPQAVPVVNVWNLRKEQMAQARANNSQSQMTQAVQNTRPQISQDKGIPQASELSSIPNGSPPAGSGSSQKPAINGNGTGGHQSKKASSAQSTRSAVPPSVEDSTSWPTVGMSVTAPAASQRSTSNDDVSSTDGKGAKLEETRGMDDDKSGSGALAKKGTSRLNTVSSLHLVAFILFRVLLQECPAFWLRQSTHILHCEFHR